MTGELNREQIDNLLRSQVLGRLGCQANGQIYVVPITYAYDGEYLYLHTKEGLKTELMRANPQVCFEVDHIENMANWQSVIFWGTYEELEGEEADNALRYLSNRMVPLVTSETYRPHYGLHQKPAGRMDARTKMVVFRIKMDQATGRYEKSQ